jgi:hypothetical protein
MKIRHSVLSRPEPRGTSPRRLAAAGRALARERERFGLFAKQVLVEQETAADRIRRIDAENLRHDQSFRDLAAKHWREGRRLLRSVLPDIQAEVLQSWNRSGIPPRRSLLRGLRPITASPSRNPRQSPWSTQPTKPCLTTTAGLLGNRNTLVNS